MNPSASSRTFSNFIPLILGVLVLFAYYRLEFIQHPTLGSLTYPQAALERDAQKVPLFDADGNPLLDERERPREADLELSGGQLLWFAGAVLLLLGVWNVIEPRLDATIAILVGLLGTLSSAYFVVFGRTYLAEGATYLAQMGVGFWVLLILSVLLLAQLAFPRVTPSPYFKPSRLLGNQEAVLLFVIVILLVGVGILNPRFLAERNLLDILQGNAYIAVAAIGMTMVIITGNIDISVGSLIALLAVISGRMVVNDVPIVISWIAPIVLGGIIGAGIGWLVAYLRVPSIVVTLAMLSILKGGLIIWTNGERVTDMPLGYYLAQWKPFGVAMPIWFMVILTLVAIVWMRYSGLGRSLYAVGGNKEAARLSGISERTVVLQAFALNGVFAGIAALLYATQFQLIQATPPPFLELNIITASVVGGVSILGGIGTVLGSTLATILINMIRSGMVFINIDPFWLKSVQGLLILITVLADLLRRRNQQ
ncbi:MAG: ABC transporter permease [Phototrophicaceae bacterium]